MKAICYSVRCSQSTQETPRRVEKENVPLFRTTCPDCGHALVWKKSKGAHIMRSPSYRKKAGLEGQVG